MASTLIVGDIVTTSAWAESLLADGHIVETRNNALEFQDRFTGDPVDILVVNVIHADRGEGMLIPQARAVWPDCRIVAVTPDYAFRTSVLYRMGLWKPHQVLLEPVSPGALRAIVTALWTQIEALRITREVATERHRAVPAAAHANVIGLKRAVDTG